MFSDIKLSIKHDRSAYPGTEKKARSLRIVTDHIEFSGGPKRPIHIGAIAGGDFKATVLVSNAHGAKFEDTLWKRFVDSLDYDAIPPQVVIKAGGDTKAEVGKVYREEMQWPLFFAAKLRKHFSQTPYLANVRAETTKLVSEYADKMKEWREPLPVALLQNIQSAIRYNTDIDGHLISYTRKQDITSQGKAIQDFVNKNSFDDLIEIVATTGGDSSKMEIAVDDNRKDLKQNKEEIGKIERSVDALSGQLAKYSQELNSNNEQTKQRSNLLKQISEDEFKRQKDAQGAKQWATVAASAVVIAASMGAAAPGVAAAAAAGLSMTGELVYSHNAGKPMTALDVANAGVTAYEASLKFQESWKAASVKKAEMLDVYNGNAILDGPEPEKGEKDLRKPLTRTKVAAKYLLALTDAANKAKEIAGKDVATPTELSLSEREEKDNAMKELLVTHARLMKDIGQIEEQITAATEKMELLTATSLKLIDMDATLRAAKPENDQQAARWNAIALALWSRHVEQISGMLSGYRRSLYFETGKTPTGLNDVLSYPNELVSEIAVGILDTFGGVGSLAQADEIRRRMKEQKTKFILAVQETINAIDNAYDEYLASRNEADVYKRSFRFRADAVSEVQRGFIEVINGQIAQQIVGKAKVEDLFPAYIPYEIPVGANEYPERLIRAVIVDVAFDSPKEKVGTGAIDFVVIHPGYGEMRRGDSCFEVDFRVRPTDWRQFTTPFEQVSPRWLIREPMKVTITKEQSARYYTYYPARTSYHLLVNVVSKNWKSIPKVREIEIGFEVMQ